MLHAILKEENNRFGYVYQDAYVVESGIDKDSNDKCLIIVGDTCNATLHELITYRKMTKQTWSERHF